MAACYTAVKMHRCVFFEGAVADAEKLFFKSIVFSLASRFPHFQEKTLLGGPYLTGQ